MCRARVFVAVKGIGLCGNGAFIHNTPVALDRIEISVATGLAFIPDEQTGKDFIVDEVDCD